MRRSAPTARFSPVATAFAARWSSGPARGRTGSFEIERFIDAGTDKVLYLWHERGSGKSSAVPMDQHGATVVTLRDGRIIHLQAYVDRSAAFASVGLSEH